MIEKSFMNQNQTCPCSNGLAFKLKRKNGEWELPRVQETFSCKTTLFKMDPSARKLQEPGNKQNKNYCKLTEL